MYELTPTPAPPRTARCKLRKIGKVRVLVIVYFLFAVKLVCEYEAREAGAGDKNSRELEAAREEGRRSRTRGVSDDCTMFTRT